MPTAEEEVATIPISASVRDQDPPPVPDSELLAAFVERQDPAALTAIVERYSALVYRVALRSLNDRHLADDVFQATFLVLAQSARRIKDGDLLAAWLHGTARNLARRALTHKQSQRHQLSISTSLTRSQKGGEMSTPAELDPLDQLVRRHEQQLLDEELQNLPESSRAPLVLYYLEEKSQAEIAQLMGLSVEAVEGRLRRAKHDLRLRLIRRGVTLSGVVAAATLLTPSFAAAAPTPALISTTITAALGTAAGTSLAAASTTAATLATKEVAAMSLASKATAFVFGTAGVLTVTAGLIFGAVVTSMGREGAERQAAEARVLTERSQQSEEISTELALVDEVPAELAQAASPSVEQPSSGDQPKSTVYQLSDLLLEQRDQIQEFVKGLGAESTWHPTTQSLVIRADSKTHEKIAEELSEMRKQVVEAEAEIQKLKVELSERQSVLAKDHPDVQQLEDKIRQLQLSMEARDLLREKDNEILKWQKMYREEQIEKEMQRDQVARREKMNAPLVEKLNAATSNEELPTMVTAELNWAEKMFSSLSHDFGDVAPGSVHQHVIRITNRYKEPVTLTVPEQLCTCGTVTLDKTVLQSREAALLTITVDTVKYRGQRVATISLNASFEPKNSKPVRIPVTANILRAGIGNGDARLTNVDRENGTVWLNIGEQQNVKTQITFSVYDKSQSRLVHNPAIVKARIEVVETRENSSIARIVEETDPIEVGDIVDSPAWKARGSEHFALSGISDLNGDGVSDGRDRTTLMNHLNHHGAVIDVEITSEGVREPADGKLTDQTKWLVVGEVPANAVSQEHLKLVEEAREQGVRIVALQDFLTYMGWKPERRVYLPTPDRDGVILIDKPESSVTIMQDQPQLLRLPDYIESAGGFSSKIVSVAPVKPNEILLTGLTTGSTTLEVKDRNKKLYKVFLTIREVDEIDVTGRFEGESQIHESIVRVRMVERQKHRFLGEAKIQSMSSEHPDIANASDNWVWALRPGHTTVKAVDADQRSYTLHIEVIPTPEAAITKFRSLSPEEKRIYDKLSQHTALEFPNNTLSEAALYIGARHMIPVRLDEEALADAGYLADPRIKLVDNTRLDYALNRLMQQIQEPKLDYCIDNGVLLITTVEKMNSLSRLRLYDISSLTAGQQQSVRSYAQSLVPQVFPVGTSLALETNLTTHKKLEAFLTGVTEISKKSLASDPLASPTAVAQPNRLKSVAEESPVSRTETITLEQTELTIQPDEVVHLQFPGPITRAEVQYDRAIDVTPVAEQAAQLRVRGTLAGSCELIATLQNDMIYRVQFQVGKVPEYRFRDLAPMEQKIRRALDQKVSLEFPGSSLHEICEFITLMHDIPVQLHGNELKAAGISLDLKVNAVISGISLRSALKLLLEDPKLDYCVDDGALIITTPAELKDRKRLDYYNLSSLSADWQAAAELLIRPLATEVTSLEGGLLVDASLDAHRKLEEFLEQAYQVEMKKPPRPVELGMTKASELPPESEEADKNQPQVRFRVIGFEADQTAIKSLATPSTLLMTPLPDFHRLLKEQSEGKGVRVVNDTNLVTRIGQPCAWMSNGAFIPSGTDSSAFAGNQIIISPIRWDDQDRLVARVSIDLSQLQSQPMVNPEDQTVVGRTVRTTIKLPADHTGLIIDVGNVDREYQLKHAYLWISGEPILPAVSDTSPPKTAQVGSPSQETQQILAAWQAKATSVRTFSGKLKRIQFDSVSRTETRSEGLLQFERPDQGRIDFSPAPVAWLQKPGRTPPEGKPYKVVSGEPSSIVSTGNDVYMLNFNHKTYDIIDIAPALKGNFLNRLPPHLQFGMQPPPQDGSYSFQLGAFHNPDGSRLDPHGAPMPKLIHLVATCQLPLEQRSVKPVKFLGIEWPIFRPDPDNLEYLLNPETYLPINMRIVDPTGQHETVYSFDHSSFKVDGGFSHPLANPFQRPNVGGWQLTYHMRDDLKPEPATPTLPKAAPTSSPDSNEAAVQPETIAKEIKLVELSNTTPSEVAEALKLLIEPESWKGTRDIKPLGKSIIVRNTREIVDRCSEAVAEMIAKQQKPTAQ